MKYKEKGKIFSAGYDRLVVEEYFVQKQKDFNNLMSELGKRGETFLIDDTLYIAALIEKYEKSLQDLNKCKKEDFASQINIVKTRASLFFNLGKAWAFLGEQSQEPSDFYKAIQAFKESERFGNNQASFWIYYGKSCFAIGKILASYDYYQLSSSLFQKAIFISSRRNENESLRSAWKYFAIVCSFLALLTCEESAFIKADQTFQEAILACPQEPELWLEWAKLYAQYGNRVKDLNLVQIALDKLAASKLVECDSLGVLILVSDVLGSLGVSFGRWPLLKEAKKKLHNASMISAFDPHLIIGFGKCLVNHGVYFDDDKYFAKAVNRFKSAISKQSFNYSAWEGLFHAYLFWGERQRDSYLIGKAIKAVTRMVELSPLCPYTYAEAAMAYLKLFLVLHRKKEQKNSKKEKEKTLYQAIYYYEKAIELRSTLLFEWLYHLAKTYTFLGLLTADASQYEKAINYFLRIYVKAPHFMHIQYELASVFSHLGELTENIKDLYEAIHLFDAIIKKDPEEGRALIERGYSYLLLFQIEFDPLFPEKKNDFLSYAEKDFLTAARLGIDAAYYHLACLYSLAKLFDTAFFYLNRAANARCIPDIETLEQEEWLEGIRQTPFFQEFIEKLGGNHE